jgi:hypothetical protein
MTEDRFSRLSKLSSIIYDKLLNDSVHISLKDKNYYEYVRMHIKDRFENEGNLYEFKDFISYLKYSKNGYNKHKVYINILLDNGDYLSNVSEYDLNYYKERIFKVVIGKDEDKTIFTKTSEYAFVTKDKEESNIVKINPVLKCNDKINIYKKEDILDLLKDDNVIVSKDLYIYCDLDLDINIKCKSIFSDYDLSMGNLDALNVRVKNLTANTIKLTNLNAEDVNVRSVEALNKIKAHNIVYYSVCFAYNNIECKSIKGTRNNSKHFSLDGELLIHE